MNIFYVDKDPVLAARALPDTHIVKMPTETVQMLVSACIRNHLCHGVLTVAGSLHRGGYANHPCTRWAGDNRANFQWLWRHGVALCHEYEKRYGREHAAAAQLHQLRGCMDWMPSGLFTTPPLAMPDECKTADAVEAYRNCIRFKIVKKPERFVWNKGQAAPEWL